MPATDPYYVTCQLTCASYLFTTPKPMLREWREEFARHLYALGVLAKATRRITRTAKKSDEQAQGHISPDQPDGVLPLIRRPPSNT